MTAPLWTDDLLAALAANGKSSAAGIARDLYFRPAYSLSVYTEAARRACRITENPTDLSAAKGAAR
jgi:hypothetical protein